MSITQDDFTFTITVQYDYEPTRTEVANLAKYISRSTASSVITKTTQVEGEYIGLWDVEFIFTCTRVQAARALNPSRFPKLYSVIMTVHIPELNSHFCVAKFTATQVYYIPWPNITYTVHSTDKAAS